MCASVASSSSVQRTFDPTALPSRWLDCPRKSAIIAEKFVAFKTPLDDRFKDHITVAQRWTCKMLIDALKREQKNLGLVIDLTNTERFYKSDVEFKEKQIRYEKIRCRGHGETPNEQQTNRFVEICRDFINTNPNDIIGVHCTHGFNRSGFLICSFLYKEFDMSIDAAILTFSAARPPGIYKQDYLDELSRIYAHDGPLILAPERPEWCLTNSDDEDEPNERATGAGPGVKRKAENIDGHQPKRSRGDTPRNPNPQFAVSLPGVTALLDSQATISIQLKCQRMCEWNGRGFPGSQPVSMDIKNYMIIVQSPYMVSWKADGTRYMMLIDGENKIYMFDRDHSVFEISHIRFPKDPDDKESHLTNTLVDGELVIDNVNGTKVPRYLIYDIIVYENENVATKPFRERLDLIRRSIVGVRNDAITKGKIDRTLDPFSIRNKDFWDISAVHKLVGEKFRSQIAHEVDGLIFQPEQDPYTPGRSPRVLKWKEDNTIDFLLKICQEKPKIGQLADKKAYLFVNGLTQPFSQMHYTPELKKYDNKIIECSFVNRQWRFLRERTDKSFPNARETAFGAVDAIQQPITKEMLCSLIDHHLSQIHHHQDQP